MVKGKGITAEAIADAALEHVREKGYRNYTVRDLAFRLGVKAASLYKHVGGIQEIDMELGRRAAAEMNAALSAAIDGKNRDDALKAVGHAYRMFALQEPELYRTILEVPSLRGRENSIQIGRVSFDALKAVAAQYAMAPQEAVHFARCYRSALHGFVAQQRLGYYSANVADIEKSFDFLLGGFARWANELEDKAKPIEPVQMAGRS